MKVDSVDPTINSIQKMNASSARAAKGKRPEALPKSVDAPPKAEVTDQGDTKVETENTTEERGVIRLLEQGHFKGVADVRLRINFFDELTSRASAAGASAVSAGSGEFVESVLSEAQGLLDELSPDEDTQQAAQTALEEFQQTVHQAITDSTANGVVDRDTLESSVKSAFGTLLTQLKTLLTWPDPAGGTIEPPVDETDEVGETGESIVGDDTIDDAIGDESGDESSSMVDLEAAMASLTQTFESALSRLLASADTASNLPPLSSPPSGQGVAYAKFLAIYESLLQGTTEPAVDPLEEPPVDPLEPPVDPIEEPPADPSNDEAIDVMV